MLESYLQSRYRNTRISYHTYAEVTKTEKFVRALRTRVLTPVDRDAREDGPADEQSVATFE